MPSCSRYRYRTAALAGPWRDRREEAIADALRAGQMRRGEAGADVVWVVGGRIEDEPREVSPAAE